MTDHDYLSLAYINPVSFCPCMKISRVPDPVSIQASSHHASRAVKHPKSILYSLKRVITINFLSLDP